MKINRFLSELLCVALLLSFFCTPSQAADGDTPPFDGKGTAEEPYLIDNTRQLWALSALVNAGVDKYAQAHYRLTQNIDVGPADWVPIGLDESTPFRGVFDGDGHGVASLRSWDQDQRADYGGFFGVIQGAVIDDLYVEGNIGGNVYAGQLVAWAKDSQIKNCVGKLNLSGSTLPLAGELVGRSDHSRIENCAYSYTYGCRIVSLADDTTRIVNSFSSSTGRSNHYYHEDGTCTQVWASGVTEEQTAFATSYSDFIRELNDWVDAQPEGSYRHWRVLDGAEEPTTDPERIFCPTVWPVMADYLVEVHMEAPGVDEQAQSWFSTSRSDSVRGYLAEDGVYAAQAGHMPCITGLDHIDGFQLAEVYLNGEAVGTELPVITEDSVLTLSFVRSGDISRFTMSHPDVEYPDVAADAWYGANQENIISDVTRLGFFVGRDDGRFAPEEPLLLAEAVKLAAVVHSTYTGDGYEFDQTAGEHWYDTYKEYAVQTGIMYDWEFGELTHPATRLQMAYLFQQSIPQIELIGTQSNQQYPSDVAGELERYKWSVYRLYWYGVLRGADQEGNFYPDRTITRAEAAAILVRLTLPERRFV